LFVLHNGVVVSCANVTELGRLAKPLKSLFGVTFAILNVANLELQFPKQFISRLRSVPEFHRAAKPFFGSWAMSRGDIPEKDPLVWLGFGLVELREGSLRK
jgi:hypothetical protein